MSNRVYLRHNEVEFTAHMLEDKFLQLIRNATRPDMSKIHYTEEEIDNYLAWWFLQDAVELEDEIITIFFGDGNSAHTWRDIYQTFNLINRYMKPGFSKAHDFLARDEFESGYGTFSVVFKHGKVM